MTWTHFHDMSSGGRQKLQWKHIFIEVPEKEAPSVFYAKFKRNPHRVTCTCCGSDYSLSEHKSLEEASWYERACRFVQAKRDPETGRYINDDPNVRHLEAGEPVPEGYTVSEFSGERYGRKYISMADFLKLDSVMVVRAEDISDDERSCEVPEEGYVWAGDR